MDGYQKASLTITLVAIILLLAIFLSGCGNKMSGTFVQSDSGRPSEKLTFIRGNKVLLTDKNGKSTQYPYEIENSKVKIITAARTLMFSIGKDDCLYSDDNVGTFCRENRQDEKLTALISAAEARETEKNKLIVILIIIALYIVFIHPRIISRYKKSNFISEGKLKAGGKTFNLHWVTGKVVGQGKHATTHVSGSGGGGSGGYTAPVSISSSTTIHNDIFLLDSTGKERSFQLSDFDIACREGHELIVIWAIQENRKTGHYIVVINNTTSEQYFDTAVIEKMFKHWVGGLSALLYILLVYLVAPAVMNQLSALMNLRFAANPSMSERLGISLIIWIMTVWPIVLINIGSPKINAKHFKSNFRLEDYKNNRGTALPIE